MKRPPEDAGPGPAVLPTQTSTAAPAPTVPATATPGPVERDWTVRVETEPSGARILVDGKDSGAKSPTELSLTGFEGDPRELTLSLEGHEPGVGHVTLGTTEEVRVSLKEKPKPVASGSLTVSLPWATQGKAAEILVDGQSKGRFTGSATLSLPQGKHRLTTRSVNPYVNREVSVDVAEKTQLDGSISFVRLNANAAPWCYVSVDGVRLKDTPILEFLIAPGEYDIEFEAGPKDQQGKRWVASGFVIKEGQSIVTIHNLQPPFREK